MGGAGDSTRGIEKSPDHHDQKKREEIIVKREERREKREERREKREERDKHDQYERVEGRNGSVPEWRDGTAKGRPPGGKREESREKREERRDEREHVFSCFSWSAEGVFPKDSMTLRPSRWLAVAA